MPSPILEKYRNRVFYLRLSIAALLNSIVATAYWDGSYTQAGFTTLSYALVFVLAGISIWILIVSFPRPFNPSDLFAISVRERLLQERIKTITLVLTLAAILSIIHVRADPPFPKMGLTFLVLGFIWVNWIMWPETKRDWRQDLKKWKRKR